nr:immunoglobulin heavy chain junction region [Homo sapiens]
QIHEHSLHGAEQPEI